MSRRGAARKTGKSSAGLKILIILLIIFFTAPLITYVYPFAMVAAKPGWTPPKYKNPDSFRTTFSIQDVIENRAVDGQINMLRISNPSTRLLFVEGRGWVVHLEFDVTWVTRPFYVVMYSSSYECGVRGASPAFYLSEQAARSEYQRRVDFCGRGPDAVILSRDEVGFRLYDINPQSWSLDLAPTGGQAKSQHVSLDLPTLADAGHLYIREISKSIWAFDAFTDKYFGPKGYAVKVILAEFKTPQPLETQGDLQLYKMLYGESGTLDAANIARYWAGDWPADALNIGISPDLGSGAITVDVNVRGKPLGPVPGAPTLIVVYSGSDWVFRQATPLEGWVKGYGSVIAQAKLSDYADLSRQTRVTVSLPPEKFKSPGYYLVRVEMPWGGYVAYEQKVLQVSGAGAAETGITPQGPPQELPRVSWDVKLEKFTAEHIMATNIQGTKWVWKGFQASWRFTITIDTKGYDRQIEVRVGQDAVKLDKPYYPTGECAIQKVIVSERVKGVKQYVYEASCRYLAEREDPNIPFKEYYANFVLKVDGVDQDYKQFKTQIIEPKMPEPAQLQEVLVSSGGTIPNTQTAPGGNILVSGSQSSSASSTSISGRSEAPNRQTITITSTGEGTAVISWGDGSKTVTEVKPGATEVTYEYKRPGNYTVTVAVLGKGGEIMNVKKYVATVAEAAQMSILDYLARVLYFWWRILFGWWLKW